MTRVGLRATLALLAAVGASLLFAVQASAATKPYSLVICALGTDEVCAPAPGSAADAPAAVPVGDTSVPMTATFTDENKLGTGIQLGSVNMTPPAGFRVAAATLPASCSGCTASVVGNVVQLRGLSVAPGSSLAVSMTVDDSTAAGCLVPNQVPNPTNGPLCAWTSEVKQSNDFSGPPGNDLSLDLGSSAPYSVLAQLAFVAQPHNDVLGQPISDSDYNPPPPAGTGGPVKVGVVDANGAVAGSYIGTVTLQLNTPINVTMPNPPATLAGNQENAVAGVASFGDLTVSAPDNGYTLTASTTDLPPNANSDPSGFDVQQAAALCASSKSCKTEAASNNAAGTDGGVDVTVNSASGVASELAESIDFGNWPAATRILECGQASAHFAYEAFSISRPLTTIVTTTDFELTQSNFNSAVGAQQICLAQAAPFMALNLGTNPPSLTAAMGVTLPDGTQGFAGLEPNCGTKSNQVPLGTGPCVTGRSGTLNKKTGGGTLTITDSSPTDRWGN